jgi:DedD protein
MAFFKFRKGGDDSPSTPSQPESVEAMRKRARHRLIGAAVLVTIGVVGFPLLFDTQPRPIAVDIPIEIPDRNKSKPLVLPSAPVATSGAVSGPVTAAPQAAPVAPAAAPAAPVAAVKAETKPEPKPEPPKAVAKVEPKPEPKSKTADDGAKAKALLEGGATATATAAATSASASADSRFVVQVGAFADAAKAQETRLKVERAGLKTYTHVAETKEGKRTRVRVGPFASRAEAEKAASKIKGLDLPAAILTL